MITVLRLLGFIRFSRTDGYSGQTYTLLCDAFLTDTQNYRAEQINVLFAYLGISNIWTGVERHRNVLEYMKTRDPNDTPKTLLKKIVDERNLAAHSGITNVLASDEILSLVSFVGQVVTAVAEIVRKTCATQQCSAGIRFEMFQVQHLFRADANSFAELGLGLDAEVGKSARLISY